MDRLSWESIVFYVALFIILFIATGEYKHFKNEKKIMSIEDVDRIEELEEEVRKIKKKYE